MEIRVQTLKFDADKKLLDYIQKKVSKLEKFDESVTGIDVTLSLLEKPENKHVKLQTKGIVLEQSAKTFEDALNHCVDVMKDKLVRHKEKRQDV